MKQLSFGWYEDMLLDVFQPNSCLLTKKKNHEKLQKKQKQEQKALKTAQRFQARLRKCK